jgi:hypothetical protein
MLILLLIPISIAVVAIAGESFAVLLAIIYKIL